MGVTAQKINYPFFQKNRERFCQLMKKRAESFVAIFQSGEEQERNPDSNYPFRPESNFYYLTGLAEPGCTLVISAPKKGRPQSILFAPIPTAHSSIWTGSGLDLKQILKDGSFTACRPAAEFTSAELENLLDHKAWLCLSIGENPALDSILIAAIRQLKRKVRQKSEAPLQILSPSAVLDEMRLIKNQGELAAIERAAQISSKGHTLLMKQARPNMYEFELQGILEGSFRKNGANGTAFGSIVASGNNATILHYVRNQNRIAPSELVLVDAACEYEYYASDITRTFPISGRFTEAQREIYKLVLKVQKLCIKMVRPGVSFDQLQRTTIKTLTKGLIELGILKGRAGSVIKKGIYKQFYMHGIGHFVGLDVHDVGAYYKNGKALRFKAGMVITIEPGIYIRRKGLSKHAQRYGGIGIRIEDLVLITASGCRVLTSAAPKEINEIERLMQSSCQKSV